MSTQSTGLSLAEPLERIRSGTPIITIGSLLKSIGNVILMMLIPSILKVLANPRSIVHAISGGIFAIVLSFIGFIVILVGLYTGLVPGVRRLSKIDDRFSTASTLIRIGYVWGMILLVIGIAIAVVGLISYLPVVISRGRQFAVEPLAVLATGAIMTIFSLILMLLGYIGIIILAFKFNDVEHDGLYLAAGILFILGIFVPFATFVAWILMYIALGKSIERHKAPSQ
ncbi:MAG: DUF973 family protein [Ignisphaera sp.]